MLTITTVLTRTAKFLADHGIQSSKYEAESLMAKIEYTGGSTNFDLPL